MAYLISLALSRLLGLVLYERIYLFLEHVEKIDTALEDKSLGEFDV
jgi:hypothetical protein